MQPQIIKKEKLAGSRRYFQYNDSHYKDLLAKREQFAQENWSCDESAADLTKNKTRRLKCVSDYIKVNWNALNKEFPGDNTGKRQ